MIDRTPIYTEEVLALMARTEEMITAADLAPIVKMHPSRIISDAKDGTWDLCNYQISGNRVKFCRVDFLRRMGFLGDPEPEMDVQEQLLETMTEIRDLLREMIRKEGRNHEGQQDQTVA